MDSKIPAMVGVVLGSATTGFLLAALSDHNPMTNNSLFWVALTVAIIGAVAGLIRLTRD